MKSLLNISEGFFAGCIFGSSFWFEVLLICFSKYCYCSNSI